LPGGTTIMRLTIIFIRVVTAVSLSVTAPAVTHALAAVASEFVDEALVCLCCAASAGGGGVGGGGRPQGGKQ